MIFGVCALALVAAMVWQTRHVLELEAAEIASQRQAARQETLRLALWRMDGRLATWLATESARPYFEYSAYYPLDRPYNAFLEPVREGEFLAKSPLLTFESAQLRLHFQVDATGNISSPQVPVLGELKLALNTCIGPDWAQSKSQILADLVAEIDREMLSKVAAGSGSAIDRDAAQDVLELDVASVPAAQAPAVNSEQWLMNRREYTKRAQHALEVRSQSVAVDIGSPGNRISVGAFVPLWYGAHADRLLYVREVHGGDAPILQGFVVDWPALRAELLSELDDLVPDATLEPLPTTTAGELGQGLALAGVPARLVLGEINANVVEPGRTPVRWWQVATWAAVLGVLLAVGFTLRAALSLAERRVRFASAVTHELRTPLTTFRLYVEMLADDMVTDETQRREYLATLRDESDRLAQLVENVLAYARLEEGRSPTRCEDISVDELLKQVTPVLERRADDADMSLVTGGNELAERRLHTDVTVVGQVLFNLVDNAAKYASEADDRRIHIDLTCQAGQLGISVSDHGPGVSKDGARRIFRPFERDAVEATPGVGLGLSLSRGLARELGGDLVLESADEGARFRLSLPMPS